MPKQKIFIKRFVKNPKVVFVKVDGKTITSSKIVFEGDKYESLAKKGKLLEIESRIAYIETEEAKPSVEDVLEAIDKDGEKAAIKKYGEKAVDEAYAWAEAEAEKEVAAEETRKKAEEDAAREKEEILTLNDAEGREAAIKKYGEEKVSAALVVPGDASGTGAGVDSSIPPTKTPIDPPPSDDKDKDKDKDKHGGEGHGKSHKPSLVKRIVGRFGKNKNKKK